MKTKTTWLLALTLSEWLNWVAVGRLRLNNRMIQIASQNDLDGFAAVMHHTPDVSFLNDGDFILAELKPNWSEFQEVLESTRASSVMWLRLESVKEFLPLSERGTRLLEGDAYRARVALGQPKYEDAWNTWCNNEIKSRAKKRGNALVEALGLTGLNISNLPSEVLPFLLGDTPLPNAEKTSKLESTRALAWANAFAVFGELVGQDEKTTQTEKLDLKVLIGKLQIDYQINDPILLKSPYLHVADELSQAIKGHCGLNLSVRLLVVVFHYFGIISAEKEISLKALIEDLIVLRESSDFESAANAAYLIGRKMKDIPVTSLFYSKFSELFPSLTKRELPLSLDVLNLLKHNGTEITTGAELNRDGELVPSEATRRQDNETPPFTSQIDCEKSNNTPEESSVKIDPNPQKISDKKTPQKRKSRK